MKWFAEYYMKHGANLLIFMYVNLFVHGGKKLKWLELLGLSYGEKTLINCSLSSFPEPFMVELGKNVYVASDVMFLTHDGAYSHMSRALKITDKRTDKLGMITVGDNCFVGWGSTIMPNVTIGENSIVAACAVVTKDVPPNSVVGGAPAKVICSIQEYLEKNKHLNDFTCGMPYNEKRKYYEDKRTEKNQDREYK